MIVENIVSYQKVTKVTEVTAISTSCTSYEIVQQDENSVTFVTSVTLGECI